eukprot:scaffold33432_cov23-Tisochrysis_lutea.AAC.1
MQARTHTHTYTCSQTGAIPCVTIGCSADSEEAAGEKQSPPSFLADDKALEQQMLSLNWMTKRKKEAEARQEEVKRQAQAVYDRERERKEKNFSDIEAKSSFT